MAGDSQRGWLKGRAARCGSRMYKGGEIEVCRWSWGLGSIWSEGCVRGCVPVGGRGAVQRETEGRGDGKIWNDTINAPCSRRRETLIVQMACCYVAIVSG